MWVCAGVHRCAHACTWVGVGGCLCARLCVICAGVHRCVWKSAEVCECLRVCVLDEFLRIFSREESQCISGL